MYNRQNIHFGGVAMHCMKCGRESKDKGVFCADCLAVMARFPVKPDTALYIPKKPVVAVTKKKVSRKRELEPEELMARMRHTIRWMCIALAVIFLAFALTAGMLLELLNERDDTANFGRNYTVVDEN